MQQGRVIWHIYIAPPPPIYNIYKSKSLVIKSTVKYTCIQTRFKRRKFCCFLFCFALRPGQQFFSHFGTESTLISNGDEVSCTRTQHRAPSEDRTHDLAIRNPTLSKLSNECSQKKMKKEKLHSRKML